MLGLALFDWLYSGLGNLIAFFYGVIPSYGFAIVMLTIAVRTILIPLTAKQVKSQRAMQLLQPELKKLQAKHKGDRQKLNEEMMNLYKEHKANPLAGCLPLILQMPLFIVLYRLIIDLSKIPPRHIPLDSDLYQALLASQGRLESFGMDLAEKPQTFLGLLLVAAVVGTGYIQQKQMTARMPKDSINPQMQMVTKIFPVFFGLISLSVPAGVVVYFVVSNLWQMGQQWVAFRTRPMPLVADDDEDDAPKVKGSGRSTGGAGAGARPAPPGKAGTGKGGPTKSGGSVSKSGGPKGAGSPKAGSNAGSSKGGGPKNQGGGGANRPPSGRVTPKKTTGRVTPKGGPGGANGSGSGAGQRSGKAGSGSKAAESKAAESSAGPSIGDSLRNRLSPMNRAAKPKRPPPAARPKGLPPTKGSSGGSSRKES